MGGAHAAGIMVVGINWNARSVPRGYSTELNSWSTSGRKNGYLLIVVERVG